MAAKDGSMAFDFSGVYTEILDFKSIRKRLDDGRHVVITFEQEGDMTGITETFEPDQNAPELQKQGWQAILNNFKNYVENQ